MSQQKSPKENKKGRYFNKWIRFSNIGLQMGIIIGLCIYFGMWLDGKFPNEYTIGTICFSLFGVFAALYNVWRQVGKMND